MKVIPETCRAH